MLNIILERLNKKNGQVFTQDDIKKIDDNAINIENTLNNLSTVASSGSYNDLTNKPTFQWLSFNLF